MHVKTCICMRGSCILMRLMNMDEVYEYGLDSHSYA